MSLLLNNKEYIIYSIIKKLDSTFTVKEIAAYINWNENLISTYISMLRRKNKIIKTGKRRKYNQKGTSLVEYKRR